ncbi:hypothetical protein B0H14DRAFT_3051045, partial [Mycena olivaceomarginata]
DGSVCVNAECPYLHHAHCVGARHDTRILGCPSGCQVQRFPREAADFSLSDPHLIVVWDGDKVDKIPVPSSTDGSLITLSTEAVIALVETFLEERQSALPGLSLRVHFRDPVAETVRFTQSTLVSVCPSSSHLNQGHRRFPLFPAKTRDIITLEPLTPFSVDLHTSHAPIVACGCTPVRRLFSSPSPSPGSPAPEQTTVLLYAVQRKNDATSKSKSKSKAAAALGPDKPQRVTTTASKESMFLDDAAWQPSVEQTTRGMAALLSSLYLFAHSVAQKGVAAEQKVLAAAYAVLRFPPAIRTLAGKAALAEALYHALKDFSSRGPAAIANRETRRFETARIFLAHLASAADAESAATAQRPVQEISLICAVSRKRLLDPVLFNSAVVGRTAAALHQRGGALYRPNHSAPPPQLVELSNTDSVVMLLPCVPGLTGASATATLLLRVSDIGWPPRAFMVPLDTAARDFIAAIRRANQTDLVSQGPLDLKSVDVVPPRIVVDQEGLLAVFTGRGCGTSRDVNFFRPMNGGDAEVDVNDVGHALQQVIRTREAEDTWQVDSFSGVLNISRPPDEAIVLCLDLSESMSRKSGVQTSAGPTARDPALDPEVAADSIAAECVRGMKDTDIVDSAKTYLQALHLQCHHPWTTLSKRSAPRGSNLLDDIALLAARDLLQLSFSQEDRAGRTPDRMTAAAMNQLSCFIRAVSDDTTNEELRLFLIQLLDSPDMATIGSEPFSVPRKFIDFRTGELLTDPVHPRNAPPGIFVQRTSVQWLEQNLWPLGHSVPLDLPAPRLKRAVATWISGAELLPQVEERNLITIDLRHGGETTSWRLRRSTTTRTLYSLAHRATSAKFSGFALKICGPISSNSIITESPSLTLEGTALSVHGGIVEIIRSIPHTRKTLDIQVTCTHGGPSLRVVVPQDASALVVLSYVDVWSDGMEDSAMTDITLWHGLRDSGDGTSRGTPLDPDSALLRLSVDYNADAIVLESRAWVQMSRGARQAREESRHLTRLHLLKELFNVFLNRASSFDTSVSLVLGLVTFSNKASADQELTPIFENFRKQLDRKEAGGDTAIYEALDSARRMLTQYRPDLPKLRKRIIIVSDGEDTSSTTSAQEVCLALQRARVVVDSVQVGPRSDPILHSISVATGGYRFSPNTSLADALSIFDLETMLYSGERSPRIGEPFVHQVTSPYLLLSYQNQSLYPIDLITVDKFPPRAAHPLLAAPVKSAAAATSVGMGGDDRMKRIMREVSCVQSLARAELNFLLAPTDVENCPYKGGTFLLTCDLPAGYPRDPPQVRFVTFIMHPNSTDPTQVCIAELGRLWSSDITLKEIFSLVYGTLLTPDLENPLEIQASLKYYEDDGTYALAVADATAKHASKTRAQWKAELELDEEDDDDDLYV